MSFTALTMLDDSFCTFITLGICLPSLGEVSDSFFPEVSLFGGISANGPRVSIIIAMAKTKNQLLWWFQYSARNIAYPY